MRCKWYKVCPLRKLEKQGKINGKFRKEYCETKENWKNCKRYQMAEKGISHPDNLMPDGKYLKI